MNEHSVNPVINSKRKFLVFVLLTTISASLLTGFTPKPNQTLKDATKTKSVEIDAQLKRTLETMQGTGTNAEQDYKAEREKFLAEPDAIEKIERQFFSGKSTPQESPREWLLVHLASKVKTTASLQFLLRVALEPMPASFPTDEGHHKDHHKDHHKGDQEFKNRLSSSIAIATLVAEDVPGGKKVLLELFKNATPELVRMAALELFSRGKLTKALSREANLRGVQTNFRRHSPEEHKALMELAPEQLNNVTNKTTKQAMPIPSLNN